MAHKFVVRIGNSLHTYEQYEDIPTDFDHLVEFSPEIPPPPHTDEQHREIESWNRRFVRLMEVEYASSR